MGVWGKRGERKKRVRDEAGKKGAGKGADIHQYPLLSLKRWSLDMKHCLLPFLARPLEIQAESFRREGEKEGGREGGRGRER